MSLSSGMFNIIQQARMTSAAARYPAATSAPGAGSTNPLTWSLKKNESAIQSFWRLAPEEAAKRAPSLDLVKRLEKLADSDNKDIAAEKLRQAKARLAALRQQLQMAAASNDPRQIKRLAAEAARLAREVGAAARALSQGVAGGTASYASQADGATDAGLQTRLTQSSERELAFKALHDIGTDARAAIADAKGLIALAAQMSRARRKAREEEEDEAYFRRLQEMADDGLADVEAGQREALGEMLLPADPGIADATGLAASTEISLEISVTSITSEKSLAVIA